MRKVELKHLDPENPKVQELATEIYNRMLAANKFRYNCRDRAWTVEEVDTMYHNIRLNLQAIHSLLAIDPDSDLPEMGTRCVLYRAHYFIHNWLMFCNNQGISTDPTKMILMLNDGIDHINKIAKWSNIDMLYSAINTFVALTNRLFDDHDKLASLAIVSALWHVFNASSFSDELRLALYLIDATRQAMTLPKDKVAQTYRTIPEHYYVRVLFDVQSSPYDSEDWTVMHNAVLNGAVLGEDSNVAKFSALIKETFPNYYTVMEMRSDEVFDFIVKARNLAAEADGKKREFSEGMTELLKEDAGNLLDAIKNSAVKPFTQACNGIFLQYGNGPANPVAITESLEQLMQIRLKQFAVAGLAKSLGLAGD